ncbi:GNAT family N-acetyltransferase [Niallia sp. FSL R7-0271]|uniref:GNAT family N-acetyltransferase n=1 Tax=Niallia sp. FSL R7-0271 TaxID=2921678 RepID=UPI0030FC8C4F
MKYTDRSLRILKYAEIEAEKTNQVVYPVHLLLGILLDRTGVCAELYINYPSLTEILNELVYKMQLDEADEGIDYQPFTINISKTTKRVLETANNRMKHFNQVYLNEGHIVDAIFKINDPLTNKIIDGLDVSLILEIVSYPRDMIVSLKDYSIPTISTNNITFRRAKQSDAASLKTFVEKEFGNAWIESIEIGFIQEDIPIFIALEGSGIIGFACFDVVRMKKGLFGPMGTSISTRTQGIGYTLLHYCLNEMKEIGYEYAVIGEAGPIEFYEKACNAVVIPKRFPLE